MEEKIWNKMLDEYINEPITQYGAYGKFLDYVREQACPEEMRAIVLEVERRIKAVVNREKWNSNYFLRKFSEQEQEVIGNYLSCRDAVLGQMMLHPTEQEVERLGYLNDKLFRLTQDCYEQCRNLWLTLYESPYKIDDRYLYEVEGAVRFEYGDDDAVISMDNDDYYGSDFKYMIRLQDELISQGRSKMDSIVNGTFANFFEDKEAALRGLTNTLDDGVSWNEGHLHNEAFDKYCICYAMHALHTHQDYCLPDILRMDDFVVKVHLQYEQEVCDTRNCPDNLNDQHWAEGVPCIKENSNLQEVRQS